MNKKIKAITFTCAALALASCDNDDMPANSPPAAEINNLVISGNWVVESLIDDGDDETADYAQYVLSFSSDGQVVAAHNTDAGLTRTGTYRIYEDDGRIELEMNFTNPMTIEELNDDWYYVLRSGNTITWDDSGDVLIIRQQ